MSRHKAAPAASASELAAYEETRVKTHAASSWLRIGFSACRIDLEVLVRAE